MTAQDSTIRIRDELNDEKLLSFLEAVEMDVVKHRGVNHPFLTAFSTSEDKSKNKEFFLEFYYFIHHLPFYIAGMSMSTRDEKVLREIAVNVAEEVGERDKRPHLDIYRDFLSSIGIEEQERNSYKCHDNTNKIDQGVKELYTQRDIITSMGAMFALETMSSKMVSLINDGLESQGYDDKVRWFFELHIVAEQGHGNGVFNAVAPYLNAEENRSAFKAGANEFMNLIDGFWDGVHDACQVH